MTLEQQKEFIDGVFDYMLQHPEVNASVTFGHKEHVYAFVRNEKFRGFRIVYSLEELYGIDWEKQRKKDEEELWEKADQLGYDLVEKSE